MRSFACAFCWSWLGDTPVKKITSNRDGPCVSFNLNLRSPLSHSQTSNSWVWKVNVRWVPPGKEKPLVTRSPSHYTWSMCLILVTFSNLKIPEPLIGEAVKQLAKCKPVTKEDQRRSKKTKEDQRLVWFYSRLASLVHFGFSILRPSLINRRRSWGSCSCRRRSGAQNLPAKGWSCNGKRTRHDCNMILVSFLAHVLQILLIVMESNAFNIHTHTWTSFMPAWLSRHSLGFLKSLWAGPVVLFILLYTYATI